MPPDATRALASEKQQKITCASVGAAGERIDDGLDRDAGRAFSGEAIDAG